MNVRWKIAQFVELFWWKRYLGKKDHREYSNWKRTYWEEFLARLNLGSLENSRIMDVGCGPAGINTVLSQSKELVAIDPLLDSYMTLDYFDASEYPWVEYHSKSLENFDSEKRFDMIFCINAINHVANIEVAFEKLIKLLHTDGTLILSSDVHRFPWLKTLFRIFPGDILHPQQHDLNDYLRLIKRKNCKTFRNFRMKRELIFDYQVFIIKKNIYGQTSH
jgi:2-polyprenyl-6-hydroxyphenyl methylase/3-demethylubiquinone-9 3-methyltransferase